MEKLKEVKLDMNAVKEFISESSPSTAIYVGCDSKVATKYGRKVAVYVTAIVVHKDSNAGAKLFKQVVILADYGNMRQRLMQEVYLVAEIGLDIIETVGERPFEVHLDVNPDKLHKSSIVVREATGYILGMLGIDAKVKPDAFAASFAADRYAVKIAGG